MFTFLCKFKLSLKIVIWYWHETQCYIEDAQHLKWSWRKLRLNFFTQKSECNWTSRCFSSYWKIDGNNNADSPKVGRITMDTDAGH